MRIRKHREASLELNMTSMLDVVFLLIIFFILVTNFSAADLPELDPPDPEPSKAREVENEVTRIVNLVPLTTTNDQGNQEMLGRAKQAVAYGEELPLNSDGFTRLTNLLKRERERREENEETMIVDLRVHRSIPYREVQPLMQAIARAQIRRVNLVALVETNPVD